MVSCSEELNDPLKSCSSGQCQCDFPPLHNVAGKCFPSIFQSFSGWQEIHRTTSKVTQFASKPFPISSLFTFLSRSGKIHATPRHLPQTSRSRVLFSPASIGAWKMHKLFSPACEHVSLLVFSSYPSFEARLMKCTKVCQTLSEGVLINCSVSLLIETGMRFLWTILKFKGVICLV